MDEMDEGYLVCLVIELGVILVDLDLFCEFKVPAGDEGWIKREGGVLTLQSPLLQSPFSISLLR